MNLPAVRIIIAIIAAVACLGGAWISARAGVARLFSKSSAINGSLPVAQQAVRLAPNDAEAHRALGAVLRYMDQLPEAEREYEIAASLRPRDDLIWLELGTIRDELDDSEGAVAALNESVRFAPFYAHPRWQRGNVLLRQGRYDAAFADLRQAANSKLELQPNLIDLTWGISKFDAKLTEQILQIDNEPMRISFARFLARKGLGPEALAQLQQCGPVSDQVRREMVANLIGKKSFAAARELWATSPARLEVFDGGFEAPLSLEEFGFGWRVTRVEGVALSIDTTEKQSGSKSLRVQFSGNSNPEAPMLSQLVLVEPSKHYRLNFATRTQEVVTGGLPVIAVMSASTDQPIAKSAPIKAGTNGWEMNGVEFATGAETHAVWINLKRDLCAATPCPIFGVVWLDSFSIESL